MFMAFEGMPDVSKALALKIQLTQVDEAKRLESIGKTVEQWLTVSSGLLSPMFGQTGNPENQRQKKRGANLYDALRALELLDKDDIEKGYNDSI